jgi:prolyl oligopeptidase
VKTVLAAAVMLSGPAVAAPLGNPAVAPPPAIPFHETVFGVAVDDPYRWMEDPAKLPAMTDWAVKSTNATVAELALLPERAAFAALSDRALRAGVQRRRATLAGARLFFMQMDPADRVAKLMVREGGRDRVLLDPIAGQTGIAAIGNYSVAPDGKTVAVQVAPGGGEVGSVRFLDVASGAQKGAAIGPVWGEFPVAWLPQGKVAYTRMADPAAGADPIQNMHLALIAPGDAGPGRFVLGPGVAGAPPFDPVEFPLLETAPTSSYAMGLGDGARPDDRVLVSPADALAEGAPRWRVIAGYDDQVEASGHVLLGKDIYLLTTKDSPNGRVERRDLTSAGSAASVVLPEGDLVLTGLEAATDGLYVSAQRDGISHLLFLPHGTGKAREVALPFDGALSGLLADRTDGKSVKFGLDGWTRPLIEYRARAGRALPLGLASAAWPGAAGVTAKRDEAVSADGTHVPMVILLPPGGQHAPLPTILEGYGGYGISVVEPYYGPNYLTWVAHGGAFAFCGTRGGNERGRLWQDAGRAERKANAQADFIACAMRLEAAGYTRASMLVAMGTSAGGALVPAAVIKRPELFAGLLERVGLVNATRLAVAENGPDQYNEMGDPRTAAGFAALSAEDAYQMLGSATDLPDTLVTIGLNDHRVAPWMGAKFAARARAKFGDRRLVLLRAEAQGGHGVGSALDRVIAEQADTYAFAWYGTHRPAGAKQP